MFGQGFTLLDFTGAASGRLEAAARRCGMPVLRHRIDNAVAQALYGRGLVLVRPDGHVAWRADEEPDDCMAMVDAVRGGGSRVAVRHGRHSQRWLQFLQSQTAA